MAGEERPDIVIGCCGGGSNLGGIALPFVPDAERRPAGRGAVLVPDAHRRARSSTTSATPPG